MTQLASTNWFDETPDSAFLRERQLVGDPRDPNSRKLVPISRASLWRMVKSGRFPPPQKLGPNTTVWNVGLVRTWLLERKQAAANCPSIKVPTQHPSQLSTSLSTVSPRQTRALSNTVSRTAPHNHQPPLQAEHSPGAKNAMLELPIVEGTKTNAAKKRSSRVRSVG